MEKKNLNSRKKLQGLEFDETILRKIYTPLIVGILLVPLGVIAGDFSENKILAQFVVSMGSIIMGLSGIWTIKYRIVPGIPTLRGKVAVAFGILFILMFTGGGIVSIFATIFDW